MRNETAEGGIVVRVDAIGWVDQGAANMQSDVWWIDAKVSETGHSLDLGGTTGVLEEAGYGGQVNSLKKPLADAMIGRPSSNLTMATAGSSRD